MIALLSQPEAPALAWLAENHGVYVLQTPRMVYTVADGAEIKGVYVITWRNDRTAELHVYGAVTPATTRAIFSLAFVGHDVHRLEIITSRENRTIRRGAPKMGFRFECVKRDYYGPGQDGFLYAMTAGECRWIKGGSDGIDVQPAADGAAATAGAGDAAGADV